MGGRQSTILDIPAFVRCDGFYSSAADANRPKKTTAEAMPLAAWCAWLRFEGNGGCILKRDEEDVQQIRGQWQVAGEDCVHVAIISVEALAGVVALPRAIVVREGPAEDSVYVAVEGVPGDTLFTFVPEEPEAEQMRPPAPAAVGVG